MDRRVVINCDTFPVAIKNYPVLVSGSVTCIHLNVTFFVQLGFSSDRVTTEKVQYNTDLLERRHTFLYRNDGVINN